VSEAVAALWESVFRHGGFAALAGRAPEQLIRWEADYGWTRRGYGQVAGKETLLAVPLARLLTTPDMWRKFAESYLEALEMAGRKAYLDFAVKVGAELPSRAREIATERARTTTYAGTT